MTRNMRMNTILWTGVLGPPFAWGLQLQTNYALARFLCGNGWLAPAFHVTSIVTLVLAGGTGIYAYVATQRADAAAPDATRQHFMAVIGAMMGATFAVLILAQWSARFFVDPCVY